MDTENKFTSIFSLKERDGWPVSKYDLHGKKHFAGVFCADHVAATEFVIGATLVNIGANAFDILIGLLVGNLLAVLTWTFITAPIAVKTRLSLYTYIKKIAGDNTILLFNVLNIVMFAVFTGTMIDPIIIISAPLPLRSYKLPNKGVRRIVPNGNNAGIEPANLASTPNLFTIRSEAYLRNGNTDE